MDTREKLRAAASVPEVPYWSGLVAGLAMAGAKIVPEDLWDEIGKWANAGDDDDEDDRSFDLVGFKKHVNHARTDAHETWQNWLIHELVDENPGKTVWVIPFDELSCLAAQDEMYCDLIDVIRFTFVGTEDELRATLAKAL